MVVDVPPAGKGLSVTVAEKSVTVAGKSVTVAEKRLTLGVLEVMPPQGPDLVLTADIPHRETDVLIFNRLHVEA